MTRSGAPAALREVATSAPDPAYFAIRIIARQLEDGGPGGFTVSSARQCFARLVSQATSPDEIAAYDLAGEALAGCEA